MLSHMKSEGNIVYVLYSLIKKLQVPVSSFTIEKNLLDHPDYPSMLSLTDCLTSWSITNEVVKLDKEACEVNKLPVPFIAHLEKRDGGEFVLVHGIGQDTVSFSSEKYRKTDLKLVEFRKYWNGVILYAEKGDDSGERDYNQSLIKGWLSEAKVPFLILSLLCCIFYTVDFGSASLLYLALVSIKLAGVSISCLLLLHSINTNNPLIKNLCSLGKKNNCNIILKSDAAKVTSWLNWSEVGMFYFAGSLICLLMNPLAITALGWLNMLCLPYTVYSVAYQFKIKNWCILCCFVQILLWMELLVFLSAGFSFPALDMELSEMTSILLCFLVPIAIWAFIKPYLLSFELVKPLNQQLKKFKYNSTLFYQLLSSQKKYLVPDTLKPIILGNPAAETIITMVSNPFCRPCAIAHKTLEKWLSERDDIQLKIVFATADHDGDEKTKVVRHFSSITLLNDAKLIIEALNNWYGQKEKKYETWARQYPVSINGEIIEVVQKQKEWCNYAEIVFTPTIFINGYKLPEPYKLDDIKYLLA